MGKMHFFIELNLIFFTRTARYRDKYLVLIMLLGRKTKQYFACDVAVVGPESDVVAVQQGTQDGNKKWQQ